MTDSELHAIFSDWAEWVRTRSLYAPNPNPQSIIGSMVRLPGLREGNAKLDPFLSRLHLAVISAEPEQSALVQLYYIGASTKGRYRRGKVPIKSIAQSLGISRKTFYQRLRETRRVIFSASQGDNLEVDRRLHEA